MTNSPNNPYSRPTAQVSDSAYQNSYNETSYSAAPLSPSQPIETQPANELDRLRDILYGRKSKLTDDRLESLENQLRALKEQLDSQLEEETTNLRTFFMAEFESFHHQYSAKLEQQSTQFTTALENLRRELHEQLESQDANQTEQLRMVKRTLNEKLDALSADSTVRLQEAQQTLSERLQTLQTHQTERISGLQADTRKRDEALRSEFLETSSLLKSQKVSRREMTQVLVELAHRLQAEE